MESLELKRKEVSKEKSKVYRARGKCTGIFELQKQMAEYKICEEVYQSGDLFFQDEHDKWIALNEELKQQGYSYEEVEHLREHYRREYARVRMEESEVKKQIRIARSILKETEMETQGKLEEREQRLEKEQPKR